jgi:hypothetical protein
MKNYEFRKLPSQKAREADFQRDRQPYRQDPPVSAPVSVSTAFATSNLATFVKEPLRPQVPQTERRSGRGDIEITTPRQGEGFQPPPPPSPSISPPHSHSHLLVILISTIGNTVRIFDITIESIYTMFSIFDLVMSE